MRGVRESRGVSRFSQARSSHCALRRRAEAAPQDKTPHGHARRFPEAVCQPAGRTMNGPCHLRQCNRPVETLADMFAGLGNHRIKACAIAHGLPNQMVHQLLRRNTVAGCGAASEGTQPMIERQRYKTAVSAVGKAGPLDALGFEKEHCCSAECGMRMRDIRWD